jgi:hypothetical protein
MECKRFAVHHTLPAWKRRGLNSCSHTFFMEPTTHFDLSDVSFEEFVSFLFNHDEPSESEEYDHWFFHVEVEFDTNSIAGY